MSNIGVPIEGFSDFSRQVAAEGAVLLKNDDHSLSLKRAEKVAVFGRIQYDYYRSGTGSGGSVNVLYTTNLIDGLLEDKTVSIDETVLEAYQTFIKGHPFDDGGGAWAAEPWFQEEMPLMDAFVQQASERNDKAIIVIGRTAGEDQDNRAEKGSYYLTDKEDAMIKLVTRYFDRVVVLLNTSNIIDLSFVESYDPSSVMYTWHGGMEGGRAAVDVLVGKVTPSGKLPDTIAYQLADYPSSQHFGSDVQNQYVEDIYVGYRYFETFCPDKVRYPFGFGLSYTTFKVEPKPFQYDPAKQQFSFSVTLTNTGDVSGKETIQLYVESPQGTLGQPAKRLIGFMKTRLLASGETETLEINVSLHQLASYDDSGVTGFISSDVLESGDYLFHIGTSVRDTDIVYDENNQPYHLTETIQVRQAEEALKPMTPFKRMKPGKRRADGTYDCLLEPVPLRQQDIKKRITDRLPESLSFKATTYTLQDVLNKKITLDDFIRQLTDEDLAILVRGEGMASPLVTPGTASAFGGVSDRLLSLGIPVGCTADGPSGIRMDSGEKATQVPIGTLLASTFNPDLIEVLYRYEGKELIQNEIDLLLGPGINIHRHPLNGRNFEYFSEDPYLTGTMAIANVRGIRKEGAHAVAKHFACNSQEQSRNQVDAVVSERALRDVYLKGFEMAVKEADLTGIMTAYNPVNGHFSASNYDLNTTILREDWGFRGIVMTDWWAHMNDPVNQGEPSRANTDHMIRSQNDLYMVVNNGTAEINMAGDNTLKGLQVGTVTRGELQRSAKNICRVLLALPVMTRKQVFRDDSGLIPSQSGVVNHPLLTTQPLAVSNETMTTFNVNETKAYRMYVSYTSTGDELSQSVLKVTLNETVVATVQANGTNEVELQQKLPKVTLEQGTYTLRFDVQKAGIYVKKIIFVLVD